MMKLITGAVAAATLGGAALAGTGAQAQGWRGGYGGYHRGYGNGALVGVGLLGLAAGVAIADRPHYGYGGGYGYAPAYYDGGGYGYYGGCRTAWRYDPYIGRDVPVRHCW